MAWDRTRHPRLAGQMTEHQPNYGEEDVTERQDWKQKAREIV